MKKPFISALAAGAAMCVFAYFLVAEFLPAAWALLVGAGVGALAACVAYNPAEVWRAMVVTWRTTSGATGRAMVVTWRTTSGATGRAIVCVAKWLFVTLPLAVGKAAVAVVDTAKFLLLHRTAVTFYNAFWVLLVGGGIVHLIEHIIVTEESRGRLFFEHPIASSCLLVVVAAVLIVVWVVAWFLPNSYSLEYALLEITDKTTGAWHWKARTPGWFLERINNLVSLPATGRKERAGWEERPLWATENIQEEFLSVLFGGSNEQTPYSNLSWIKLLLLWTALKHYLVFRLLGYTVYWGIAAPFRIIGWAWKFVVVVWRQIHSRMRVMAMVDGSFGGLMALIGANQWDSNLLNQSPLTKLAVIGLGVVLAEVFGYINYRLVALEVLKIQPTE